MAVVSCTYQPSKATGSGEWRLSHVLNETWLVRLDAPPPATTASAILTAPGVGYGTAHPTFTSCKAVRWDYSAADGAGLAWYVTVQYVVPIIEIGADGLPLDVWSGRGTTTNQPFFKTTRARLSKTPRAIRSRGWNGKSIFSGGRWFGVTPRWR